MEKKKIIDFFIKEDENYKKIIYNLKKELFFKALIMINKKGYSGYFYDYEKYSFLKSLEKFNPFEDEIIGYNLWLERISLGVSDYNLNDLRQSLIDINSDPKIYNFKNYVIINEKKYDLKKALKYFTKKKISDIIINNKNN